MNTTVIFILFLILSTSLSGQETPNNSLIGEVKTELLTTDNQSKTNHTILVKGEANVVKIEKGNTKNNSLSATRHIDINGTNNVVKIKDAEGNVIVKQTGHHNQIAITQKRNKAPIKKQQQKYKPHTKGMKKSPPK